MEYLHEARGRAAPCDHSPAGRGPDVTAVRHPQVPIAARTGRLRNGCLPVILSTDRGDVACRFSPCGTAAAAALWVGGGGGFDTPAKGLYPRLADQLMADGIASLRVRFRDPLDLVEATFDALAGLAFLEQQGGKRVALVGHSFGGAVVIQAAAASRLAHTVVTLATQSHGADAVARLGPHCSILLIHGQADRVLPPSSSRYAYELAQQPKRLLLCPDADHSLDQAADEVHRVVRAWIVEHLAA